MSFVRSLACFSFVQSGVPGFHDVFYFMIFDVRSFVRSFFVVQSFVCSMPSLSCFVMYSEYFVRFVRDFARFFRDCCPA